MEGNIDIRKFGEFLEGNPSLDEVKKYIYNYVIENGGNINVIGRFKYNMINIAVCFNRFDVATFLHNLNCNPLIHDGNKLMSALGQAIKKGMSTKAVLSNKSNGRQNMTYYREVEIDDIKLQANNFSKKVIDKETQSLEIKYFPHLMSILAECHNMTILEYVIQAEILPICNCNRSLSKMVRKYLEEKGDDNDEYVRRIELYEVTSSVKLHLPTLEKFNDKIKDHITTAIDKDDDVLLSKIICWSFIRNRQSCDTHFGGSFSHGSILEDALKAKAYRCAKYLLSKGHRYDEELYVSDKIKKEHEHVFKEYVNESILPRFEVE